MLLHSRCIGAIGLLAIILLAFEASHLYLRQQHSTSTRPTYTQVANWLHLTNGWKWDVNRDRNDHSLTSAQCHQAFPNLYHEIARSKNFWSRKLGSGKKLGEESWDFKKWSKNGGLRALIWEKALYIVETQNLTFDHYWKERELAILHSIQRALLSSRETMPNIEFSIKVQDLVELTGEENTVWCFSRDVEDRSMKGAWLIPDFNFWAYPRVFGAYSDFQRQALELYDDYESKDPRLVWRGTVKWNAGLRSKLIHQSQAKPWADVSEVVEDVYDEDTMRRRISILDHCKYKFAVHTEGISYSSRLNYLLACHSTVIIHKLRYLTSYYHLLQSEGEDQNYILCDSNWTQLPAIMDEMLQEPGSAKARAVADEAAATFRDRYLTPAAQSCYWRELFKAWSEVTSPTSFYKKVRLQNGNTGKVRRRVMSYEEYLFWNQDYSEEDTEFETT